MNFRSTIKPERKRKKKKKKFVLKILTLKFLFYLKGLTFCALSTQVGVKLS